MNVQNKSNIYTINDAAPPSYAEATSLSASRTYNPEFIQRYPHIVVRPSPSTSFPYPYSSNYLNNMPVQSTYPEYESAERQNQSISYSRTLITGNKEERAYSRLIQCLWIVCTLASIVGILMLIIRITR